VKEAPERLVAMVATDSEERAARMKFVIKNRWNASIIFEAEIECDADASEGVKLWLAVRVAVRAGADLTGATLTGANLTGVTLASAYLARADLAGANLTGANLARAYLARADLAGADLTGANLARADLAGADLAGADLTGANLAGVTLASAYLARADLAGANLAGANLTGADLARANLTDANLTRADLAGAKGADMTRQPVELSGLAYPILITDTMIKIGCEQHTTVDWSSFDNKRIARMDGCAARRFWAAHKATILALAAAHQAVRSEAVEAA